MRQRGLPEVDQLEAMLKKQQGETLSKPLVEIGDPDPAPSDEQELDDELRGLEDVAPVIEAQLSVFPRNRSSATAHRPYPAKRGGTVKVSFHLEVNARREIEEFLHSLGPRRRNLWVEKMLLVQVRAAKRRAQKKAVGP
jgi:hypothetical protein